MLKFIAILTMVLSFSATAAVSCYDIDLHLKKADFDGDGVTDQEYYKTDFNIDQDQSTHIKLLNQYVVFTVAEKKAFILYAVVLLDKKKDQCFLSFKTKDHYVSEYLIEDYFSEDGTMKLLSVEDKLRTEIKFSNM